MTDPVERLAKEIIECKERMRIANGGMAFHELAELIINKGYINRDQAVEYCEVCSHCDGIHRKCCELCGGKGIVAKKEQG